MCVLLMQPSKWHNGSWDIIAIDRDIRDIQNNVYFTDHVHDAAYSSNAADVSVDASRVWQVMHISHRVAQNLRQRIMRPKDTRTKLLQQPL